MEPPKMERECQMYIEGVAVQSSSYSLKYFGNSVNKCYIRFQIIRHAIVGPTLCSISPSKFCLFNCFIGGRTQFKGDFNI